MSLVQVRLLFNENNMSLSTVRVCSYCQDSSDTGKETTFDNDVIAVFQLH
jgi:hypothetical protein